MKKKFLPIALMMCIALTSCNGAVATLNTGLDAPVKPIADYFTDEVVEYTNEGTPSEIVGEYGTEDDICHVIIYEEYFDVTLNETDCTPYEAGLAYGQAVRILCPDIDEAMEPYIFENIRGAFPDIGDDYTPVEDRMFSLFSSLDEHYRQEISGLCEAMCGDVHGICPDNVISVEEMMLMQMVPDALRPTACSGLSLWGSKTETGDMITLRCLEWNLGSDNSMTKVHTVLHIVNGDKSFTAFSFIGLLDVISGINDDGVFAAMLDANCELPYDSEGRTCYSFAIRHILEEYDTAEEAGRYMVDNAESFTFAHNVLITDGDEAFCAEDAPAQLTEAGMGQPVLRDSSTPLMEDVQWDSPDSFCVVNTFLSEGNFDNMSGSYHNLVRFAKYNEWVAAEDQFSVADLKDMMTQEVVDTRLYGLPIIYNVHRDNLTQMIIVDYDTGNVQVAFTGIDGVTDKPVFTDVGNYTGWY